MKCVKLSVLTVAICVGAIVTGTTQQASAQTGATAPSKVGLIDMAKVFQDYTKFKDLRAKLKVEIERSDAEAKRLATNVQKIQGEMKDLKAGSAVYAQKEKQLLAARGAFEAYRAGEQRDLMRKESQIYKQIYVEVTNGVAKYAQFAKYTLVIRFSPKGADKAESPQDIVDSMNRQVVYHRPGDDITDKVLNYLNRNYASAKGAAPKRAAAAPSRTPRR